MRLVVALSWALLSVCLVGGPTAARSSSSSGTPAVGAAGGVDLAGLPGDPGACTRAAAGGDRVWHVAVSGDNAGPGTSAAPFRTIVRALRAAGPGDVVRVHEGTYAEGAAGEYRALVLSTPDVRMCAARAAEVVVRPRRPAVTYGLEIDAGGVVVDGIDLVGFATTGVQLGNGDPLTGVTLRNLTVAPSGSGGKDGIATYGTAVDDLLLERVTVDNAFIGIQCNVGPCTDWRLDDVVVRNDPSQGDTGNDAIAVEGGDNFLLTDIEATGAAGDGVDFKGTRVAVFGADVHDNARNGVKFWRGGDLVNSLVVGSGADAAVVFDGAGTYRIVNSVVAYQNWPQGGSYTLTAGYDRPDDPIELTLRNSVFHRNSGAVAVSRGTALTIDHCLFTPTVDGQVVAVADQDGTGTVVDVADGVGALGGVATVSGNLPFGTRPGFVAPPTDFHLRRTSALIDAGTTAGTLPSLDADGRPRVIGAAPDLGPYEVAASPGEKVGLREAVTIRSRRWPSARPIPRRRVAWWSSMRRSGSTTT